MNYKNVAEEVLKNIGGKENISHFEHCSTRLRFSLFDNSKINKEKLEAISGVLAVKMTGQCQVVIGNEVIEVYDEMVKLIGHVENKGLFTRSPRGNLTPCSGNQYPLFLRKRTLLV